MKTAIAILAALSMTACTPMTQEQASLLQANFAAQQHANQVLYAQQMQAINAWGADNRSRAGVSCITSYVGQSAYTNCR